MRQPIDTTAALISLGLLLLPRPSRAERADQIGVLIVEEQLGLKPTDLDGLRAIAARLPFEPCMSLLSILAGRVEKTITRPAEQLAIAEGFFGASGLVERYRELTRQDETAHIFGPQSLYTLMRVLIDGAYDAPITQELTPEERLPLMEAIVASNSVIERSTDSSVGPSSEDLLAYELQAGNYYARPSWMEQMSRARELYRLATEDPDLIASKEFEPVKDWIERSDLSAEEQWLWLWRVGRSRAQATVHRRARGTGSRPRRAPPGARAAAPASTRPVPNDRGARSVPRHGRVCANVGSRSP